MLSLPCVLIERSCWVLYACRRKSQLGEASMKNKPLSGRQWSRTSSRIWSCTWPTIVICAIALIASPWLLGPQCPSRIVIAAGPSDGAYYNYAMQYQKILAEDGITLEVRTSEGSVENERLLADDDVSLAIIQGGIATGEARLQALASLYQEPVWIFHRSKKDIDSISQLKGMRVAIGPVGSGVRAISLELLADNEIGVGDSDTILFDYGMTEAAQRLKAAEIDAAILVVSPASPVVRNLLTEDGIRLASIRRSEAYQLHHPFLSRATLPEGVADFRNNKPDRDIKLLAPTANLVATANIHHALVPLLLRAVEQVHSGSGELIQSDSFPTAQFTDYPLNAAADRYFRTGPSLLYRYLPFSLAAWLDRVKLILLPMCTLLIPLLKFAPPVYRWRIRSKIYRWYRVLREIDLQLKEAGDDVDLTDYRERLSKLDRELFEVSVPLSYMEEFYNLRIHVAYVKDKLGEPSEALLIRRAA